MSSLAEGAENLRAGGLSKNVLCRSIKIERPSIEIKSMLWRLIWTFKLYLILLIAYYYYPHHLLFNFERNHSSPRDGELKEIKLNFN